MPARRGPRGLVTFEIAVGDLLLEIHIAEERRVEALRAAQGHWEQVAGFLAAHPAFVDAFVPVDVEGPLPPVVEAMSGASKALGTAPMVALPGALAEAIARDLAAAGTPVAISTEGDTFAIGSEPRRFLVELPSTVAPSGIGVRVASRRPYAFYASTIRSRIHPAVGYARAVAVLAEHGALADAAASAMGMAMVRREQIDRAIERVRGIAGVRGALLLIDETVAVWGSLELTGALARASGSR